MTTSASPKHLCLYPRCKKHTKSLGLCSSHYSRARYLVSHKMTTWDKLEKAGKIKRRRNGGTSLSKEAKWFLGNKK